MNPPNMRSVGAKYAETFDKQYFWTRNFDTSFRISPRTCRLCCCRMSCMPHIPTTISESTSILWLSFIYLYAWKYQSASCCYAYYNPIESYPSLILQKGPGSSPKSSNRIARGWLDEPPSNSNSGFDSSSDSGSNSGYSSNRRLDLEAEHYCKIRAEFVVASPNLANPCNTTKKIIEREEQK